MEEVTMQTKGLTQDNEGHYGVWRTDKYHNKYFIRVGETPEQAFSRRISELWKITGEKLKEKASKPRKDNLDSLVFDKIRVINKMLETNDNVRITICGINYVYRIEVRKGKGYRVLWKRRNT